MSGQGPTPSSESLDETIVSQAGTGRRLHEASSFARGDLVGRYVVLEEIGRGAMGLVVSAYDPELDRKIAVKLVRVSPGVTDSTSGPRARLVREAQAMAKLAHPNVITIHDVGTAGDDVFIAMEFVDGGSLREWLSQKRRSWQEIVAAFVQAGEGLAAAHAQGIIHRDFKPDNVLVRSDGRVGVADFGLARRDDSRPEWSPSSSESLTATLRDSSVDTPGLTLTGATLGTPAYMAPEQHLRADLDHRADQFAFCVALWEALVGQRPYPGTTLGAIALSVTSGKIDEFPRDSPVPARIRAALERGLQTHPDARFPDMGPLLDELRGALQADRRNFGPVWKRPWVWALGVAALLSTAVIIHSLSDKPAPAARLCAGASDRMIGVWDEDIEAEARAAFERSERAFAQRSFDRADATLDRLREQWEASHTAACEATRIYGEQSEDMLDRRMSCLARRRGEIAAVSSALRVGNEATIEGVDGLLATIGPIADCDDLEQLRLGLPPAPPDRRAEVDALRDRIADLEVRRRTTNNAEAKPEAAALLREAETLGYAPLVAEALNIQAAVVDDTEGPNEALPIARRAMAVAAEAGHRRALVEAMSMLGWIEGVGRANYDFGLWLLDQAAAEARALGDPVRESLRIRTNRGAVLFGLGDNDAALREFEAALAFAREKLGDDNLRVADLRFNIAAVHQGLDHFELAEHAFRLAIEHYTELMGADHPEVAQCHSNLAVSLVSLGKLDEAELHANKAIEIWEADGGHSYLPSAYATLGEAALARGDLELARERFERVHAMKREIFGADNPTTLEALVRLTKVEDRLGRADEARAHYKQGIEAGVATAPDHPVVLELRLGLATLELRQQQFAAAARQLDTVEASATRAEIPVLVGAAKLVRAQLELRRGHAREARSLLDEAEPLLRDWGDSEWLTTATTLRAELERDGSQLR